MSTTVAAPITAPITAPKPVPVVAKPVPVVAKTTPKLGGGGKFKDKLKMLFKSKKVMIIGGVSVVAIVGYIIITNSSTPGASPPPPSKNNSVYNGATPSTTQSIVFSSPDIELYVDDGPTGPSNSSSPSNDVQFTAYKQEQTQAPKAMEGLASSLKSAQDSLSSMNNDLSNLQLLLQAGEKDSITPTIQDGLEKSSTTASDGTANVTLIAAQKAVQAVDDYYRIVLATVNSSLDSLATNTVSLTKQEIQATLNSFILAQSMIDLYNQIISQFVIDYVNEMVVYNNAYNNLLNCVSQVTALSTQSTLSTGVLNTLYQSISVFETDINVNGGKAANGATTYMKQLNDLYKKSDGLYSQYADKTQNKPSWPNSPYIYTYYIWPQSAIDQLKVNADEATRILIDMNTNAQGFVDRINNYWTFFIEAAANFLVQANGTVSGFDPLAKSGYYHEAFSAYNNVDILLNSIKIRMGELQGYIKSLEGENSFYETLKGYSTKYPNEFSQVMYINKIVPDTILNIIPKSYSTTPSGSITSNPESITITQGTKTINTSDFITQCMTILDTSFNNYKELPIWKAASNALDSDGATTSFIKSYPLTSTDILNPSDTSVLDQIKTTFNKNNSLNDFKSNINDMNTKIESMIENFYNTVGTYIPVISEINQSSTMMKWNLNSVVHKPDANPPVVIVGIPNTVVYNIPSNPGKDETAQSTLQLIGEMRMTGTQNPNATWKRVGGIWGMANTAALQRDGEATRTKIT